MTTMTEIQIPMNPAEEASVKALNDVYGCLDHGESFRLEAGAGAGKTYEPIAKLAKHTELTLIKA
jgi:DNA helicase-2/ATP-dependent DNA helicase PcrA